MVRRRAHAYRGSRAVVRRWVDSVSYGDRPRHDGIARGGLFRWERVGAEARIQRRFSDEDGVSGAGEGEWSCPGGIVDGGDHGC